MQGSGRNPDNQRRRRSLTLTSAQSAKPWRNAKNGFLGPLQGMLAQTSACGAAALTTPKELRTCQEFHRDPRYANASASHGQSRGPTLPPPTDRPRSDSRRHPRGARPLPKGNAARQYRPLRPHRDAEAARWDGFTRREPYAALVLQRQYGVARWVPRQSSRSGAGL
jgi:hypothetical protein